MGVSPAAMNLPEGPRDPFIYNFGMVGARPRMVLLNLIRLRSEGIKPRAALIELSPLLLAQDRSAEHELSRWGDRLSYSDLEQLSPYAPSLRALRAEWALSRLNAWPRFRLRLMSAGAPNWVPAKLQETAGGSKMDSYGFLPHRKEASNKNALARARSKYFGERPLLDRVPEEADRSIRDLVSLCRSEGVETALFWVPESPAFREFYGPLERSVAHDYGLRLAREEKLAVFPAPDHLPESDFFDGHHLLGHGAAKYSRWLADTHLKPWLARHVR